MTEPIIPPFAGEPVVDVIEDAPPPKKRTRGPARRIASPLSVEQLAQLHHFAGALADVRAYAAGMLDGGWRCIRDLEAALREVERRCAKALGEEPLE